MRVAVVGGGVIGLLSAHHLRKRGADVTVLERGSIGCGCSAGNAGWITPSIALPLPAPGLRLRSLRWMLSAESPLYIRPSAAPRMVGFLTRFWKHCNRRDFERGARAMAELGAETMELWDELRADGVAYEDSREGLLMVFREQESLEKELALLRLVGYEPPELLEGDALHEREPSLSRELVHGAHVVPERTVRPETVCSGTATRLEADGGAVREHSAVTGIELEGSRVRAVSLESGEQVEADAVLVATGAEAARLSAAAGRPLPLQAGKGYSTTVEGPRLKLRYPLYLGDAMIGVTPFEGFLRVAGTMELSGINLELDERRAAALERGAGREVPGVLEGGKRRRWVGMRPLTPDGLPVLGRLPRTDNVYVATGHQMLGVTLAPSTGKAMAELILEGRSGVDLEPFRADRFGR